MRLLFLMIDGLPTVRPDVMALWDKYLPRAGCAADVVTARQPGTPDDASLWSSGRALTYRQRGNAVLNGVVDFVHDCARLVLMPRGRYDAIQLRDKSFVGLVALIVARLRGLPFFYWMSFPYAASLLELSRTPAVRGNRLRRAYLWWRGQVGGFLLYRIVLPRADHIFVQSDRMAEEVASQGLDRAKLTPVPMCIDPDRFSQMLPRQAAPFVPNGARVIGYLGECSRARRIDFLIDAVSLCRRQWPDAYLLIVGDAVSVEDKAWLRACVREAGLEQHCHITGWVEPEEATRILAASEICAALVPPDPLLDVASPTKLVEYLVMGRPVVANNHPDQDFVLRQSGGGLSVPFEVNAFAEAISTLFASPERHAEMAARGRRWVWDNRNYVRSAPELEKIYRHLIERRASPTRADGADRPDG